jgi:hypothetical protein
MARPRPAPPSISVIIPTLNEADHLGATLASARAEAVEVIVADAGSTDATAEIARRHGATVLIGPAGRARQQNAGAAAAGGKVLLFLHADTLLPRGYPRMVRRALAREQTVAGAFRFQTPLASVGMQLVKLLVEMRCRLLQAPYGDQALFVPAEVFRRVGGFPDQPIAEDLALVRRLRPLGRIQLLRACAMTSDRRWRRMGVFRTTLRNQLVLLGLAAGVSPDRLAGLYGSAGPDA